MNGKKLICSVLSCVLAVASLAGCGANKKTSGEDGNLTYWMSIGTNAASIVSNYGETKFAKELEKRTGVSVEYLHPAVGQESEAFNLLVASDTLPDIIEYNWLSAMGGPNNSLSEGIIIELNDVFEKYCPNLMKYLKEHPEIDKQIKTDDGKYYVFPFVKGGDELLLSAGPVIRKDWLDELGLEAPRTVDEWETVLRAFKEKKGVAAPLTFTKDEKSYMFAMMGTQYYSCYVDNGKIKYGPYEPEFKTALETLARWYKEGLLDNNYLVNDNTTREANMLNGRSGATVASGGSGLGKWLQSMPADEFILRGIPYPNEDNIEYNRFIPVSNRYVPYGAAISVDCKDVEKAARFLDYAYSEEGHMLFNFGIEGESYEMVDGVPTYTEYILNNKDGLTVSQAMADYNRANYQGAFIQDVDYIRGYYSMDEQKEALSNWVSNVNFEKSAILPHLSYTKEETETNADIASEISKYVDQMTAEFISGQRSFDTYDEYLANLEKLGVKKMVSIRQAAYDRYLKK